MGKFYIKGLLFILFMLFFATEIFSAEIPDYKKPSRVQEEFAEYMQSVRDKIQSNWNSPELLEEGHAVVIFKITRDGELYAYDIKQSSGNTAFDEFAINALEKSAPFGEFPITSKKDYITVCYSFDSDVVQTDRIKELVESANHFVNVDNKMARDLIDEAIKEADGDSIAYYLYARRCKIDKLLCDDTALKEDLAECKRLKELYDRRRIQKCRVSLEKEETPFGHFALANAYDVHGDYQKALEEIEKAISMTELNQAYKRYRTEILTRIK